MAKTKNEELALAFDTLTSDLEVPNASDVVFRHTWCIKKYNKAIRRKETLDSPLFDCSVNGFHTQWNTSIRFWKSANGKRIKNPIVICLNLVKCETEESNQAKIRYQFGVWDAAIKHWECCPMSRVALNLETTVDLLSVGHRDLSILKRHIDSHGNVSIMVKIQIIQKEEEMHSLSQDLSRIFLQNEDDRFTDCIVECCNFKPSEMKLKVHSFIINTRSTVLSKLITENKDIVTNNNFKYRLDLSEISYDLAVELLRYLYTDKVDCPETNANRLLPIATRFSLHGLVALCERALLDTLTPTNVANILLLADQCGCDVLRKAALSYCEDSNEIKENVQIGKSLAWRVMELVNPELFQEACESLGSSSSNLDSPFSHSDEHL